GLRGRVITKRKKGGRGGAGGGPPPPLSRTTGRWLAYLFRTVYVPAVSRAYLSGMVRPCSGRAQRAAVFGRHYSPCGTSGSRHRRPHICRGVVVDPTLTGKGAAARAIPTPPTKHIQRIH